MTYSLDELKKIFSYILLNKNIKLSDGDVFNRDTLITLMNIISAERVNDFSLSNTQIKELINAFLKDDKGFNKNTPSIICENAICLNAAIERDCSSINYAKNVAPELISKVMRIALDRGYILSKNSPEFLSRNFEVALNSIKIDPESANYISWAPIPNDKCELLINEIINKKYTLGPNSPSILTKNKKVILNSLSSDIYTLRYASGEITRNDPEIFKYLLLHGWGFTNYDLTNSKLAVLGDAETIKTVAEKINLFDKQPIVDQDKYLLRFAELVDSAINTKPTISGFKNVLDYCTDMAWEEHRKNNIDDYTNIFGKICTELRNNPNFGDAIDELYSLLTLMRSKLAERFDQLLEAMKEYHACVHINNTNDFDNARDTIAKLSALYVAICKENFKKEEMDNYNETLIKGFLPRRNHPVILKKLLAHKYKERFKELYEQGNRDITDFTSKIISQYTDTLDETILTKMVDGFVRLGISKLDKLIRAPRGYTSYKRYKEASKLINRLNSNYIKYTDQEVSGYRDIITYNKITKKYEYLGPEFDAEYISKYQKYKEMQQIYQSIKSQIIMRARKLRITENVTEEELEAIANDLPFTDEYFECNDKYWYKYFDFSDLLNTIGVGLDADIIEPESLLNDKLFEVLKKYVTDNSLFWFLLVNEREDLIDDEGIISENIIASFDYIDEVIKLAKTFKYDINSLKNMIGLTIIASIASDEALAMFGEEIVFKLCADEDEDNRSNVIYWAEELYSKMTIRDKSTVPYVSGKTNNYHYETYDHLDPTILTAGYDTDACFRVNGFDNDFLYYCALDKNGVVIKITDNFGNFIGRASGFRNGNCVYFNQLRTIYDMSGNDYLGTIENERKDIIDAFRHACIDIVSISQNNPNEYEKIDFVFVTASYIMENETINVRNDVINKIGDWPMDTESDDWRQFANNTNNLKVGCQESGFSTDYGNYNVICMAASPKFNDDCISKIRPRHIRPDDVPAVYARARNRIVVTKPNPNLIIKMNRINSVYSFINSSDFKPVTVNDNNTIFLGDNWYIVTEGNKIISSCVITEDKHAKKEFMATKETIESESMARNTNGYTKILRKIN